MTILLISFAVRLESDQPLLCASSQITEGFTESCGTESDERIG